MQKVGLFLMLGFLDYEKKRRRDRGIEKWWLRGQAVEENGCGRDWLVW